ncbi:MAG: hypothetical protein ABSD48_18225 [Armatimonadota bacterium]|jgi:flagellar biosynthesis/type III secretory pathway protein FliH
MPFEETQEAVRATLDQVNNILTRLEPVVQKLIMSAQAAAEQLDFVGSKDIPALVSVISDKVIPDELLTTQRFRQVANDADAVLTKGVVLTITPAPGSILERLLRSEAGKAGSLTITITPSVS